MQAIKLQTTDPFQQLSCQQKKRITDEDVMSASLFDASKY